MKLSTNCNSNVPHRWDYFCSDVHRVYRVAFLNQNGIVNSNAEQSDRSTRNRQISGIALSLDTHRAELQCITRRDNIYVIYIRVLWLCYLTVRSRARCVDASFSRVVDSSKLQIRRESCTDASSPRARRARARGPGYERGNISRVGEHSLGRASRAEQMAGDISGLYRVFPLIFKILYFAQQIVPIEINPPG